MGCVGSDRIPIGNCQTVDVYESEIDRIVSGLGLVCISEFGNQGRNRLEAGFLSIHRSVEKSFRKLCPADNVFDGAHAHSMLAMSRVSTQDDTSWYSLLFGRTTYCDDSETV